jgi:hypothetical protein
MSPKDEEEKKNPASQHFNRKKKKLETKLLTGLMDSGSRRVQHKRKK